MAQGDRYKEGRDFEWVSKEGQNFKTRRFFTKAEKDAMAAPKVKAPAPTKSAASTTQKPKSTPKEKPVTKDAMKGYRAGDITSSPLPNSRVGKTVATAKSAIDKATKPAPKPTTGGRPRYKSEVTNADRLEQAKIEAAARRKKSREKAGVVDSKTSKKAPTPVPVVPSIGIGDFFKGGGLSGYWARKNKAKK